MARRLMNRDPDYRAPEPDTRRETGNPLTDGYTLINRAQQDWDGQSRMPSYAETDRPNYRGMVISMKDC